MIVQTDPRAPRVVLVGPPGAGKSTIGRKLARELGVDLYDTDAGIEDETGRTIPEIFAEDGEPEFRRIEERVVRRAILAERGVVSLGGGAVLSESTRSLLRGRTVVYLEISVAEGLRRTGASTQRPLLNGADPGAKYRELMRLRRPLYREVATVRVRTDGRSPGRVVRMILGRLGMESVVPTAEVEPEAVDETAAPQSGRRSRARRRARARAAARRRGADPDGSDTPSPAESGPSSAPSEQLARTPNSPTPETGPDANTAVPQSDSPAPAKKRTGSRRPRRRSTASSATPSPTTAPSARALSTTAPSTSATSAPAAPATTPSATAPSVSAAHATTPSATAASVSAASATAASVTPPSVTAASVTAASATDPTPPATTRDIPETPSDTLTSARSKPTEPAVRPEGGDPDPTSRSRSRRVRRPAGAPATPDIATTTRQRESERGHAAAPTAGGTSPAAIPSASASAGWQATPADSASIEAVSAATMSNADRSGSVALATASGANTAAAECVSEPRSARASVADSAAEQARGEGGESAEEQSGGRRSSGGRARRQRARRARARAAQTLTDSERRS